MKEKLILGLAIVIGMWSAPSFSDETPQWANELLAEWYEANQAQDAERIANLYTTNARWGDAIGRNEIIAGFRALWAGGEQSCVNDGFEGFEFVGGIAAGWGYDTCEVIPKDDGTTQSVTNHWLSIYEKQADGRWLIIRDLYEVVEP